MVGFIQAWAEGVEAMRGQRPSVSPYPDNEMLDAAWQLGYQGKPLSFGATFEPEE